MTDQAAIPALVSRGAAIKAQARALSEELKNIDQQLIAAGAAVYTGENGATCTVVQPMAKFAPDAAAIQEARELLTEAEEAKGEPYGAIFKKCFSREVVYSPVKAVRHIAAAMLTPGKLKRLLEICEKPSTPFVLWPK